MTRLPEPYWQSPDGAHVLYNCDCLELLPLLPEESIDALVTDPPYSSGGAFRGDRTQKTVAKYVQTTSIDTCRSEFSGDNRDSRSFLAWSSLWFTAAHAASVPGAVACCFSDWRQIPILTDSMQCGGWVWRGLATWWKPGIRMQRGRFSASAEYVIYGSHGIPSDGELSPQNVFSLKPVDGEDKDHVAEKPEAVLEWILGVTPAGSTILDPFAGSGTTAVACIRTGRRSISIEKEEKYCAIAKRRMEEAIGVGTLFDPKTLAESESPDLFAAVKERKPTPKGRKPQPTRRPVK